MTKRINKQIQDCIVFKESLSAVARINAVHKRVPTGRAWNGNDGVWEKRRAKKRLPSIVFIVWDRKLEWELGRGGPKRESGEKHLESTLTLLTWSVKMNYRYPFSLHSCDVDVGRRISVLLWVYIHPCLTWPLPDSNNSVYGPENRIWTTLANRKDPIRSGQEELS